MGRRITATEILDTLEVDLWGNIYNLREMTRTVSQKLTDAQARARETAVDQDGDQDAAAKALIDVLDILLEPKGEFAEKPAGTMLGELWKTDKLGLDWLGAFAETLREESDARRRPTSPPTSAS